MIVAVDEAIPYWKEALSPFGDLRPYRGQDLRREHLRDTDAMVVRSVTAVDAALLEGSPVRFVATASVGMDHLDLEYLESKGIAYANAAGCNANAVSEYVTAALLHISQSKGWDLEGKSIAVIGVGRVGSRVVHKAAALGMDVHLCDPPLREITGDSRYRNLLDVLGCDFLTLHVPLTRSGPYPTYHMIDRGVLDRLGPRQFLLNTSRGAVVETSALVDAIQHRRLGGAVLDVWEREPRIDYELLGLADLGTAHVAGFSLNGKIRATEMMVEALAAFTGEAVTWSSSAYYPADRVVSMPHGGRGQRAVALVVQRAYDIGRDDRLLRGLSGLPSEEAAVQFEKLRTGYALRPEFRHFVAEASPKQSALLSMCRLLGFQVREAGTS